MRNILNRFLHTIRSLLNLSSGENRAGWALLVGFPIVSTFYGQGRMEGRKVEKREKD